MNLVIPCVLMRAGTSRGPFFLREWLPADEATRNEALIGAIGASDMLQVDGLGGGSTLTCKVAIVSRSSQPGCDVDYLFAQVGVAQKSVDTRPNCGNMLSGVAPFAIEQGLVEARDGETTVRVFNLNTRSRIDATVCTPGGRVRYDGPTSIDGVAGTAAPIRLNFLDAWGAVTGSVFPTGARTDMIEGLTVTCIDAAMPLVILRAAELGLNGNEMPAEIDANPALLSRIERVRRAAGALMGLGDVSTSVVPKPVIASEGHDEDSITSRYFTPLRCHASHAVTGAIGVACARVLPGTVVSQAKPQPGTRQISVLHPQGRIEVEIQTRRHEGEIEVQRAALVRTARKILQGKLHLPDYVFSQRSAAVGVAAPADAPTGTAPGTAIKLVVPTATGGGNDTMARMIARRLALRLQQPVQVDNRAGADGSIACEYVARAPADGATLLFGYTATHAMNPALQPLQYDPVASFAPIGCVGHSPTVLVVAAGAAPQDVADLLAQLRSDAAGWAYACPGHGTAGHFAAELFNHQTGLELPGLFFEGSGPALQHLLHDHRRLMFASLFSALPLIRRGRLRALALAGARRSPWLPELQTLEEAGFLGLDMPQWYGLFAPAHTPATTLQRLQQALADTLAEPDLHERLRAHGTEVEVCTPQAMTAQVRSELARWTSVARQAALQPPRH